MKLAALPPSPTRELCPVPPHLLSPGATDQVRSSRHTGKLSRASASGKLGPAPTLGAMLGGLGQATLPLWDPAALVCCGLTPGEGLPTAKQSHPVLQGQAGGPASTSQLCRSLSHDLRRVLHLPEPRHARLRGGGTASPSRAVPRTVGPGSARNARAHTRPSKQVISHKSWTVSGPQALPPWKEDNGTQHRVTVRTE